MLFVYLFVFGAWASLMSVIVVVFRKIWFSTLPPSQASNAESEYGTRERHGMVVELEPLYSDMLDLDINDFDEDNSEIDSSCLDSE
jgi:hypothetical protein